MDHDTLVKGRGKHDQKGHMQGAKWFGFLQFEGSQESKQFNRKLSTVIQVRG